MNDMDAVNSLLDRWPELDSRDIEYLEATVADGLRALIVLSHGTSKACGWYQDPHTGEPISRNVPEMLALIHSEISEALEAFRKSLMDDHLPSLPGITVELADALLRITDLAGYLGLDLATALLAKRRFNAVRLDHKRETRAAEGGKSF